MARVLIIKSPAWGGMPLMRTIPLQLRILAHGHPVAEEWLRLVDQSRVEEVVIDDATYPRLIDVLQVMGMINADRASQLRRANF